jgi:hypothetical protein
VQLEGLGQLKNSVTSILPACSIVPQPTTLPRAPVYTCTCTFYNRNCSREVGDILSNGKTVTTNCM